MDWNKLYLEVIFLHIEKFSVPSLVFENKLYSLFCHISHILYVILPTIAVPMRHRSLEHTAHSLLFTKQFGNTFPVQSSYNINATLKNSHIATHRVNTHIKLCVRRCTFIHDVKTSGILSWN